MISFRLPTSDRLTSFLQEQASLHFTYNFIKQTVHIQTIPQFDNDQLKVIIGHGESDFQRAKIAIQNWQMFPKAWTRIFPQNAGIQADTTIAMMARFAGLWWRNACRIVYIIDEPDRFGFAYGTLPGHMESGEELFLVFKDADSNIWYEIKAFSKPHHWIAKVAYPLMRLLQARFRRDSAQQMRDTVSNQMI